MNLGSFFQDLTTSACDLWFCYPLPNQEETLTLAYPTEEGFQTLISDAKHPITPEGVAMVARLVRMHSEVSLYGLVSQTAFQRANSNDTLLGTRYKSNQCLFHPPYC